jgi:hypothetical protein
MAYLLIKSGCSPLKQCVSSYKLYSEFHLHPRHWHDKPPPGILTPQEIVDGLESNAFWQIHRSTLVNAKAIERVSSKCRLAHLSRRRRYAVVESPALH